jgi:hypothetical protein
MLKWKNKDAIKMHDNLIKLFGNPVGVISKLGGMSLWDERVLKNSKVFGMDNIFVEHIVRDEKVQHMCPIKHDDFFYSYIKIDISPNKLKEIIMLSGSVGYDPLKKMLYARCAGIAPNIATLKVVTDIILDKMVEVLLFDGNTNKLKKHKYKSLSDIQKKGIYGKTITRCVKDSDFLIETYSQLLKNVKKIGIGKNTAYWRGAFSYKNGKCSPPK